MKPNRRGEFETYEGQIGKRDEQHTVFYAAFDNVVLRNGIVKNYACLGCVQIRISYTDDPGSREVTCKLVNTPVGIETILTHLMLVRQKLSLKARVGPGRAHLQGRLAADGRHSETVGAFDFQLKLEFNRVRFDVIGQFYMYTNFEPTLTGSCIEGQLCRIPGKGARF